MARGRRRQDSEPTDPPKAVADNAVRLDELRRIKHLAEAQREALDGESERMKEIIASAGDHGVKPSAFKLALKVDRMEPGKRGEFLRGFDACRSAFGLDAQLDIEDAIAAQAPSGAALN